MASSRRGFLATLLAGPLAAVAALKAPRWIEYRGQHMPSTITFSQGSYHELYRKVQSKMQRDLAKNFYDESEGYRDLEWSVRDLLDE